MKLPEIDGSFFWRLLEQAATLTFTIWLFRLGLLHLQLLDTTELLYLLQGSLYCVIMIMALPPVVVLYLQFKEVGLTRGEKIEWAVVVAICLVSGYLWFTA